MSVSGGGWPKREDFGFFFLPSLGCILVAWRNKSSLPSSLFDYLLLYILFFILFLIWHVSSLIFVFMFFVNFFKFFYRLVDRVIQFRLFIILVLFTYCFFKYCCVNKLTNK